MTKSPKVWLSRALELLQSSLEPLPHEINELDWKSSLSEKRERLIEHLIAFANYPGGGYLVFGIEDIDARLTGITSGQISPIINTIANLGRDAVEPPFAIDHSVEEFRGVPLLFVHIPENNNKPVHRRGKSIEETWIRSGGTTRKASRHEVGGLLLNSRPLRWEELRASQLLNSNTVLEALDLATIARLRERPLSEDRSTLMNWLKDEKMITADGDGYYITNFGAISASRRLEDFDPLSRKRIRIIRYRGNNKVDTLDERVWPTGYAVVLKI